VHFGAKLIQNMYHETNKQENPYEAVHGIRIFGDEKRKVKVNSRHHQSVYRPEGIIRTLAVHSGISHHVEAIRIQDHPIVAVQWHPEDLSENSGIEYTLRLVNEIIKK